MATMTLAIPDKLKGEMNEFPEMNWSEAARQAFARRIRDLKILREFSKDSTLTEEDAMELGKRVNEAAAKRYCLIE
jgi:hypothetical protein